MARRNLVPFSAFDFAWRLPSLFDPEDMEVFQNTHSMTPGLSVSEDDKNVYLEAPLPGVNPDDIEITVDRGMVWIRGEGKIAQQDENRKYVQRARREFSYRFRLPDDTDPNAEPQALFENGMILLTFPKSAQAQPKRIMVKAGEAKGRQSGVQK